MNIHIPHPYFPAQVAAPRASAESVIQLAIPEVVSSKTSPQVSSTSPLRSPSATEQTDFEQAQAYIVAHQASTTIEADDAPDEALDSGY